MSHINIVLFFKHVHVFGDVPHSTGQVIIDILSIFNNLTIFQDLFFPIILNRFFFKLVFSSEVIEWYHID